MSVRIRSQVQALPQPVAGSAGVGLSVASRCLARLATTPRVVLNGLNGPPFPLCECLLVSFRVLVQGKYFTVELTQMRVGHVQDWLVHEGIQVDVLRCHEQYALKSLDRSHFAPKQLLILIE